MHALVRRLPCPLYRVSRGAFHVRMPQIKNTGVKGWGFLLLAFLLFALTSEFKQRGPLPNWERLEEEVLSRRPKSIYKEILDNQAEDVNIYVMDVGRIPEVLRDKLASEWFDDDYHKYPHFPDHGSLVLSCLLSDEYGLARQARVHYYHADNLLEYINGIKKICSDVQGPAVISFSMGLSLKDESERAAFSAVIAEHLVNPVVLGEGYPILIAAGNSRWENKDQADVPINLDHVWPIGNSTKGMFGWHFAKNSSRGQWVKFVSPGTDVKVIEYYPQFKIERRLTGSSFSAPHAAAFIARLLSIYPWMKIEVTIDHILSDQQPPYSPAVPKSSQRPILTLLKE